MASFWKRPLQARTATKAAATPAKRRDLLHEHSKKTVVVLVLLFAGLLVASFAEGAQENLPSVAFDWLFALQIVRAAVLFAIIAVLGVVFLRGWGGLWPQRISTGGIDFPELEKQVDQSQDEVAKIVGELAHEMRAELDALGRATGRAG